MTLQSTVRGSPRRPCSAAARLARWGAVSAALLATSCTTDVENVHYRDRSALLYSGRVQWHAPAIHSDRPKAFGVGAEAGGLGTAGEVTTSNGLRDYSFAAGYGAVLLEGRVNDFDFSGRFGLGYGEVDVAGRNRTVSDDGIAFVMGLESGYRLTDWSRAYVLGTFLANDGWQSSWGEAGVEFRPIPRLGLRVGYARSESIIQDIDIDLLGPLEDTAEVITDGIVLGMTLNF